MPKFNFISLPDVEVEITSIKDLFSDNHKYILYPLVEMHQCHNNAFKIASILTNTETTVEIVEGYLEDGNGTRIPHAFNKIGDKYFDVTLEKFLTNPEDFRASKYIAKRVYTKSEMLSLIGHMGGACISFDGLYKKKYKYYVTDDGLLKKEAITKQYATCSNYRYTTTISRRSRS